MDKNNALSELRGLSNILQKLSVDSKYIDAINTGIDAIRFSIEKERQEKEQKMIELAEKLKEKIGSHIFWACKGWSTNPKSIETHTISSIKYEVYIGDFFREYNGKKVIKIHIDNDDGFYIYDELGKTIFFSREEAEKSLL